MPKTIRAKVLVGTLSEAKPTSGPGGFESASMYAVRGDSDNPEDNEYAEATPSASISITVSNPACWGFFKQGKRYYVDFTEAPE